MISTHPLISKTSSSCTSLLVTVPRQPITIGIASIFMFYCFFQSPCKVQVLVLLFAFFRFYSVVSQDSKVHNSASSPFWLIITRSGLLAEIRWSVYISKFQRICVYRTYSELCIYHLFVWSNLNFLQTYKWIIVPIQSCLVLYSFWANFLHSLIIWLRVSSLSPHNLHLLFIISSIIFLHTKFSLHLYLVVFHWSLSDCKSPQVSNF